MTWKRCARGWGRSQRQPDGGYREEDETHADETGNGKERVTVIQKVKQHYTSPKVFLEILLSHSPTSLTKRDVESFGCKVALGN